jgi:hypothetical protein
MIQTRDIWLWYHVTKQVEWNSRSAALGAHSIYTHKSYMGVQLLIGHDLGYNTQQITTSHMII